MLRCQRRLEAGVDTLVKNVVNALTALNSACGHILRT